jgi:NitT/TauT family transport system substrate-binding protein
MRRSPRHLHLAAAVLVLAAGCGTRVTAEDLGARPELASITVGALPIVDSASLYIAMKKGYFADEGLQVRVQTLTSGAAAIPGLNSQQLQFALGNYVSFFDAQATGAADIKLVADAYQARPGTFLIMVNPDSPITRPRDLNGKKIAVNTRNNVVELTARSVLRSNGVDLTTVSFVPIPFPDMAAALKSHTVDAAYMVEPYITQVEKDTGALPLMDVAAGATAEFPIAAWVTSAALAKQIPNTVRAFQRAIVKGQAATQDRSEVEHVIRDDLKVDSVTVSLMSLGTWPTTLEPSRIQRVADLMSTFGQLKRPLDPRTMIVPPP